MKHVWKIIGLVVFVLLVGLVLWGYSDLYGNPVASWLAQRTMERYLAETYPGKQFHMQSIRYDMKLNAYEAHFVEGSSNSFELTGTWRKVRYDQYHDTYAKDAALSNRFTEQFTSDLKKQLMPRFPVLREIYGVIYVARDTYPPDTQFQKGMEQATDLEIALVSEDIPAEAFADLCLQMRDAILAEGYNPLWMHFSMNTSESTDGKEGMLLYSLKIDRQDYDKNLAELLPGVDAYNQKNRGK